MSEWNNDCEICGAPLARQVSLGGSALRGLCSPCMALVDRSISLSPEHREFRLRESILRAAENVGPETVAAEFPLYWDAIASVSNLVEATISKLAEERKKGSAR